MAPLPVKKGSSIKKHKKKKAFEVYIKEKKVKKWALKTVCLSNEFGIYLPFSSSPLEQKKKRGGVLA